MSQNEQLKTEAKRIADEAQSRLPELKLQLADLKARETGIKTKIETAGLCRNRVAAFEGEIDGYKQCPDCWIHNEAKTRLSPMRSSDGMKDEMRCNTCGYEITLSA